MKETLSVTFDVNVCFTKHDVRLVNLRSETVSFLKS